MQKFLGTATQILRSHLYICLYSVVCTCLHLCRKSHYIDKDVIHIHLIFQITHIVFHNKHSSLTLLSPYNILYFIYFCSSDFIYQKLCFQCRILSVHPLSEKHLKYRTRVELSRNFTITIFFFLVLHYKIVIFCHLFNLQFAIIDIIA